jgi:hypothetical protein
MTDVSDAHTRNVLDGTLREQRISALVSDVLSVSCLPHGLAAVLPQLHSAGTRMQNAQWHSLKIYIKPKVSKGLPTPVHTLSPRTLIGEKAKPKN